MAFILFEDKEKDWWKHVQPADILLLEDISSCLVCGCESRLWAFVRQKGELRLVCPGDQANRKLHKSIEMKKRLIAKDEWPPNLLEDIVIDIKEMQARIRADARHFKLSHKSSSKS